MSYSTHATSHRTLNCHDIFIFCLYMADELLLNVNLQAQYLPRTMTLTLSTPQLRLINSNYNKFRLFMGSHKLWQIWMVGEPTLVN